MSGKPPKLHQKLDRETLAESNETVSTISVNLTDRSAIDQHNNYNETGSGIRNGV